MLCAKFGWKCPNGSGEEDFKKFSIMYFNYFAIISTFRRAWPFIWKKLESSSPKNALCQVWLKMAQWFWRWRFFKSSQCIFAISKLSPLEKGVAFHLNNLNPLHPRMLCAKFGLSWTSGSWGEDFLKFSVYFYYFTIISPLGRAWPFIRTNFNPLHQVILCAKFGPVDFLKLSIYFYFFPIISSFGRAWPFIWTNLNPLHPGILCAKFVWNCFSGSGEDENV